MKQPEKMNYLLIDSSHQEDFSGVLPECMIAAGNICAIGVYDDEGHVFGAVAYRCEEFHYYIEWIFVDPEVRRRGIGGALIRKVLKIIGGTGERYPVSCLVPYSEENPELYYFLLSMQCADLAFSHDRYYLKIEEILKTAGLKGERDMTLKQTLFFDLSASEQERILRKMEQEQLFFVPKTPDWNKEYVPSLCRVILVNNNLMNLVLVKELPSGVLELAFLYSKYHRGLAEILAADATEAVRRFPGRELIFDAMSPGAVRIAEHLFPDARVSHMYEGEW